MQIDTYRVASGIALLLPFLFTSTLSATQHLIPAGSIIQCRISEKISSKVTDVGDPIVCKVSHSTLPYASYMTGSFQEFKDPGHFFGKGWMELSFDRVVMPPARAVQVSAKVIEGPGYRVDREGRILGKGHAVRDTIEWMIPILWPIDLINLPRRGPRPVLKSEIKLTLKIMEDIMVPSSSWTVSGMDDDTDSAQPRRDSNGFLERPETSGLYDIPPAKPYTTGASGFNPYAEDMSSHGAKSSQCIRRMWTGEERDMREESSMVDGTAVSM